MTYQNIFCHNYDENVRLLLVLDTNKINPIELPNINKTYNANCITFNLLKYYEQVIQFKLSYEITKFVFTHTQSSQSPNTAI